jgi:signal transduction histidine kinase
MSQVLTVGWYLISYNQKLRVDNLVTYLKDLTQNIHEVSDKELARFIELYQVDKHRIWVEDASGRVLVGEPWFGMTKMDRTADRVKRRFAFPKIEVLILKQPEPAIVAALEVTRAGRTVKFFYNWKQGSLIYDIHVFTQLTLGLLCVTVVLSLWTAKKFSRPLSYLRDQAVKIAKGDLKLRLDETGEEEVAELSKAVNELTDNLSLHIDSMKLLMANMSHEMRSVVTNIAWSLEITEETLLPFLNSRPKSEAGQKIAFNLSQARAELDLLENMVASGLLGGKLDLRHETIELGPLDFSSLCRLALDRATWRADQAGLSLSGQVEPDLWLLGDELLLDRLLANILDNALKYTQKGGFIELKLTTEADFLLLTCLNAHEALPEDQLKNLCRPYYRADSSQVQGSGLGLYLANRVTELHGGRLTVTNVDLGLLFTVSLPQPDEKQKRLAF